MSGNLSSYLVSPHCPTDYCLPHSSYLNLLFPNSQCQFSRSGVLCGQCQDGLSAVFGSSWCKQCSNVYLLIIIPIALAGIVLVTMLFAFNITIVSGTINTFIFYVNILNINISMLFPGCKPQMACTAISLFNLDLGITTCFFNGMDDYGKAWLQLAFPKYLIMIAVFLVIASRYSTRVQRLTAQRALPILATLFLLSYTKVLQTVCKVLFYYDKITHLPTKRTEYVWSIDTTVSGVKFTVIFFVCLLLFFILIPFNLVLLCTRKLSYFKIIAMFKPLLDAYLSPYKDNRFYWTGVLLLVRTIILAFSGLLKNAGFLSDVFLLCTLLSVQGILWPFKSKLNNIQESFLLLNLLIAHVSPLYKDEMVGLKIAQLVAVIGLLYLIVAITHHCIMFKCKSFVYEKIKRLCVIVCSIKAVKKGTL